MSGPDWSTWIVLAFLAVAVLVALATFIFLAWDAEGEEGEG